MRIENGNWVKQDGREKKTEKRKETLKEINWNRNNNNKQKRKENVSRITKSK